MNLEVPLVLRSHQIRTSNTLVGNFLFPYTIQQRLRSLLYRFFFFMISSIKKVALSFVAGLSLLTLVPSLALAQGEATTPSETRYGLNTVGENLNGQLPYSGDVEAGNKLPVIVGNIIRIILGLLGLIFLILVIYGGLRWMTAQGDSGAIEDARDTIVHAVIGLVIVLSAYTITAFVFDRLASLETAP